MYHSSLLRLIDPGDFKLLAIQDQGLFYHIFVQHYIKASELTGSSTSVFLLTSQGNLVLDTHHMITYLFSPPPPLYEPCR